VNLFRNIAALCGVFAMVASAPAALAAGPAIATNWTGFYVGGNVGYGWGNRGADYTANDPGSALLFAPLSAPGGKGGAPAPASFKDSGAIGGLQFGYNSQLNRNWLVGVEADFNGSGVKGSDVFSSFSPNVGPFTNTVTEKVSWFSTVRARLGYLPMDNLLAYITGGYAFGQVERTVTYAVGGSPLGGGAGGFAFVCPGSFAPCFAGSSSRTASGWTVGAGFEYAVLRNWTIKAEYLYVSLGGKSVTATAVNGNGAIPSSFDSNFGNAAFNIVRAGFNYHF
jgi:outer membrane immunogenic protein